MTHHFYSQHTLLEWRSVFWITVAVNIITLLVFLWGASGEIQPWNNMESDQKINNKKDSEFSNVIIEEKL